jgi:hypothetical protein
VLAGFQECSICQSKSRQIPDVLSSIPLENYSVMLCFIAGSVVLTASVSLHGVIRMRLIDQRTS